MGILKSFLKMGLVVLFLAGIHGTVRSTPSPLASQDEDQEEDNSGRWEGVAMARRIPPPSNNLVT